MTFKNTISHFETLKSIIKSPPMIIHQPTGLESSLETMGVSMVFNVGNTLAAIDNYHLGMVYSSHEKKNDFGDGFSWVYYSTCLFHRIYSEN